MPDLQPYSDLRDVPYQQLRAYQSIDVSLEVPVNPFDPDDDSLEEIEFELFFSTTDQGDWFYANFDGTRIDERVWNLVRTVDLYQHDPQFMFIVLDGKSVRNPPLSPAMNDWHERNLERAIDFIQELSYGDY